MRIAVAQFAPHLGNKQMNLTIMVEKLRQAKQNEADLVVFPELGLTGYTVGSQLDVISESVEGESIRKLGSVCQELGIHALVSFPEKKDSRYYISSILLKDDGTSAGVYRKTHLFDTENTYFTRGEEWPIFSTKFGKIGVMICYDLEFPEVARLLRLNGAELILVNTANMSPYEEYQQVYLRSRAMENEVPIVICNRLGTEGEYHFFGHSAAVDHKGNILFQLGSEEAVFTTEINLTPTRDPKLSYTNYLHHRIREALQECLKV